MLSNEEVARYSRHLIMPEVGMTGQRKLKAASVLMIGTGGLGAPVGMYLAAAGVGRMGLVDFDVVDASNLQRQIIHGTKDVGRPKIASARDRIQDINPHVEIETHETRLTRENALRLFVNYDVIVDGTDNFPTSYLVNELASNRKPNVYGSIFRFEGQASVFWAERSRAIVASILNHRRRVAFLREGGVLGGCRESLARFRRRNNQDHLGRRTSWLTGCFCSTPGACVSRIEAAQESGLSVVRRQSDDQRVNRLRRVLRNYSTTTDDPTNYGRNHSY
jgi:molybdopterin/thiamine biosynthesis adenylyltransferase